jgi:hypothetical protein
MLAERRLYGGNNVKKMGVIPNTLEGNMGWHEESHGILGSVSFRGIPPCGRNDTHNEMTGLEPDE